MCNRDDIILYNCYIIILLIRCDVCVCVLKCLHCKQPNVMDRAGCLIACGLRKYCQNYLFQMIYRMNGNSDCKNGRGCII